MRLLTARAISHSIYTEDDMIAELQANVREAISSHFDSAEKSLSSAGGLIKFDYFNGLLKITKDKIEKGRNKTVKQSRQA